MAKQRKGSNKATEHESGARTSEQGSAPEVQEQVALGNATLQARMETGEAETVDAAPGLDVVASVAEPLVGRALAALQLDPADAERLARRVEILEGSRLPERETLIDRLHGDEATRITVDGLLARHFGSADSETRWAVDGVLAQVRSALQTGSPTQTGWRDAQGSIEVAAGEGSLDARAMSLVDALAEARAPEGARGAATDSAGASTASLVRSLALMVLLDEEEEEEGIVDDGWQVEGA